MASSQQSRESGQKNKPCFEWQRTGVCKFGNRCVYRHHVGGQETNLILGERVVDSEANDGLSTATISPPASLLTVHVPQLMGADTLKAGRIHPKGNVVNTGNVGRANASRPTLYKTRTCKLWKQGRCHRGETCNYRHDNEADTTPNAIGDGAKAGEAAEGSMTNKPMRSTENEEEKRSNQAKQAVRRAKEREARAEFERWAREEVKRKEREEVERKEREEAERRQREEFERGAREEDERRERMAREEAQRRAREQAEGRARKLAEKKAKEEEARKVREENARRQLEERRTREATVVEKRLVLDSSLVTYAAGLEVTNFVPGFELCRITIKNIPQNARTHEVGQIFEQQGISGDHYSIVSFKRQGQHQEAVVMANVEHGGAIAAGLEGIEFRDEVLSFEISQNIGQNTMGSSSRNANTLTITWHAPTETFIAVYPSEHDAQEKVRQLNRSMCKGRRVRAALNVENARFRDPRSVKLMGFPEGAFVDLEIETFAGTAALRKLRSPGYSLDSPFRWLRVHLSSYPGVQMVTFREISRDPANLLKVQVDFVNWESAKRAFDSLENQRLGPTIPIFRAFLPRPVEYVIRIPAAQYLAQKKLWASLAENKNDPKAPYVNIKQGDRGDLVFIRVEGIDKKAVGALKVRVESMVGGERLDAACWHPYWMSRDGFEFFERVRQETNVHVRADFKTRSVKVYGSPESVLLAKAMIKAESERLATHEINFDLERRSVGFFIRKGLATLKELVGEDAVSLNVAAARITIKGGPEANHHLRRLIEESRASHAVTQSHDEKGTCPVCGDDASNPEELVCGHTYCAACLQHFFKSAVDGKNFPLICLGNEASCNTPISIPLIRRFMTEQEFQELIESAFQTYIDQHANELKYCRTPDCKQIYRHSDGQRNLQCPSCFASVCTACDQEGHEGVTCEERKMQADTSTHERLFEEWAASRNLKKCPQCERMVEKIDGCNHITCRCGTHFCYRCGKAFPYEEIYGHMNAAHGGMNDQMPELGIMDAGGLARQVEELERIQVFRNGRMAEQREAERQRLLVAQREELQRRLAVERIEAEQERRAAANRELERQAAERRRQQEQANAYLRYQNDNEVRRRREEATARAQRDDGNWCTIM